MVEKSHLVKDGGPRFIFHGGPLAVSDLCSDLNVAGLMPCSSGHGLGHLPARSLLTVPSPSTDFAALLP